ncbi:DUF6894 family protein [Sphingomonas sp. MS122]|uniref:DUF6894 family protein n=1 Tax=Sphingomonas sp. MS122 TaxID=3412683 RepID=UPI003C30DF05
MARYFFKLYDRFGQTPDVEGCILHDMAAVRQHALAAARSLMAEDVRSGQLHLSDYIEVSDDKGEVVLKLPFSGAVTIHS